jgi:hypothetical protein
MFSHGIFRLANFERLHATTPDTNTYHHFATGRNF